MDIQVASINAPDRPDDRLTHDELVEKNRTFFVKQVGAKGALIALLWLMLRSPGAVLSGLLSALRLAGSDVRSMPLQIAYWAEALILWHWAELEKLDHLHVHFATPAAMVGLLFSQMSGIPYSITVHGPDEFYDISKYRLLEKFEAASFLICISDFARSQVMRVLPYKHWGKIHVCRLGVFPEQFPCREPMIVGTGRPLNLLCVGRLCEAKGQAVLIQAVDDLVRRGLDCQLTLVGGGELRAELEELVAARQLQSRVVFTGPLNQDQVREHFAQADAFVLASFAEGVPIVLMEAMALGIPVFSTRITGIPELITDGVNGTLVPAGSISALADALLAQVELPAEVQVSRVMLARRQLEQRYNLSINIALLRDLLTQHANRRI
ncbi:MAG: glycosyltransferase [Pseudomonadota bacterium]